MKKYVYRYYVHTSSPQFLKIIQQHLLSTEGIEIDTFRIRGNRPKRLRLFEITFGDIELLYQKAREENCFSRVKFFHVFDGENFAVQISPRKRMRGIRAVEKTITENPKNKK